MLSVSHILFLTTDKILQARTSTSNQKGLFLLLSFVFFETSKQATGGGCMVAPSVKLLPAGYDGCMGGGGG